MADRHRLIGCTAALIVLVLPASASAQGLLESLFGGLFGRPSQGDANRPSPDAIEPPASRPDNGPRLAFCVRTCDGSFFPVHPHAGFSAVQMCQSFCPASVTRLYTGSSIDHAVSNDGRRYTDLPTAFVYRQHVVSGCTCNGRDAFGLASIDPSHDPTLQPGDIVSTKQGMVTINGPAPAKSGAAPAGRTVGSAGQN